ncbi:PEP-CTERM sorting domain-containing protein [Thalassobacterium sedimentorum]
MVPEPGIYGVVAGFCVIGLAVSRRKR